MRLSLSLLFCLALSYSFAQSDSEIIKDEELKISFTVPDGWQATKKDDGYLLGSANTQGFMLIKVMDFKSIKRLKSAMEAGIQQDDGSKLMPTTELTMLGEMGVSGMYDGTVEGTEMLGFLMALMPPSKTRAAVCISVAPKTIFNQSNMDQLKLLLRSVLFD